MNLFFSICNIYISNIYNFLVFAIIKHNMKCSIWLPAVSTVFTGTWSRRSDKTHGN